MECKPVLDQTHSDESDRILHAAYIYPKNADINWDELIPEEQEFEEWQLRHNDPDFVRQYETKLTLCPSCGRKNEKKKK